jgi:hypothetical protein
MKPRVHEALVEQRKAFIEKFGREPGPSDPVFFDPDEDVPTPIERARLTRIWRKAIRDAGIDPPKAEAIRKCPLKWESKIVITPRRTCERAQERPQ